MASQWQNFLRNLGEWRGTFSSINLAGATVDCTASILSLEAADDDRLVRFRLRRWPTAEQVGEPSRDISEDYRSLGRQVVFFETGSFCKGMLQVSPGTAFGGEFGFVDGVLRLRASLLQGAALLLVRDHIRLCSGDGGGPPNGPHRPRSGGVDGSVDLVEYASIEDEIETAAIWVTEQIRSGIPVEQIALIVPEIDPYAERLADHHPHTAGAVGGGVDRHLFASTRVAPGARRLDANLKVAKAGYLDVVALHELPHHEVKKRIDHVLGFAFIKTNLIKKSLREFVFCHCLIIGGHVDLVIS